ncbi:MAG: ABC transporter permease [Desulfobulbaceae bacterium]|nr:MAG: ABC transporter permease [Desulfobulbaceae bacterium]
MNNSQIDNLLPAVLRLLSTHATDFIVPGVVLACWEIAVRLFNIPRYLLPPPTEIFNLIIAQFPLLFHEAGITLLEAILGFALGCGAAFFTGSFFGVWRLVERAAMPMFVALQAVPLVAIAPLLIIWLGNGLGSKVVMAALICFFPMTINCATGIKNTSPEMVDLMKMVGATPFQLYWKARLPSALPAIFSGLKISASFSVIGAIVSELAGADKGIGYQILSSSYRTDTPMLFAAVFFAAASGIGFYQFVCFIERATFRKMGLTHRE